MDEPIEGGDHVPAPPPPILTHRTHGSGPVPVPFSIYQRCDQCNYVTHRCHFCGEDLDHFGVDSGRNFHTVAFCRPDLVEHEPGELCTWPYKGMCYWDHDNNRLMPHGQGAWEKAS